MRRTLVAAGSFALLLGSATGVAAADDDQGGDKDPAGHTVVASGLDNPRQLNWDGRTLLIAEGGQGGDDCAPPPPPPAADPAAAEGGTPAADTPAADTPAADAAAEAPAAAGSPVDDDGTADQGSGDTPVSDDTTTPGSVDDDGTPDQGSGDASLPDDTTPGSADEGSAGPLPGDRPTSDIDGNDVCDGYTAGISAVERPGWDGYGEAERVVDGLYSVEGEGTIGSDAVAATGFPGVLLIAQGEGTPDALAEPGVEPAPETQEHLLVSIDGEVYPWVDLGQEEREQNPDGKAALDSNPNAVIVVDPTPWGEPGGDEYALVADAGANAVWKVVPDFSTPDENGLPGYEVSVFAAYPADDSPTTPEFVPSSLAQDAEGNIYVGGVGSLVPGAASVVEYQDNGAEPAEELDRWDGFTGINGIAVDPDGEHVYVSQILGRASDGQGEVIRFDTDDDSYASFPVPFPSGLALGGYGSVYVSAYSTFPADADNPATPDVEPGGQVWRFSFPEETGEPPVLPVTMPPAEEPAGPETPAAPESAEGGTGTEPDASGTDTTGTGTTEPDTAEPGPVAGEDPGATVPERRGPRS